MNLTNVNPVLRKELLVKMRGWKAAAMITIYLGILAIVAYFVMEMSIRNSMTNTLSADNFKAAYTALAVIQFFLIIFIAPALTSGAISGERERQTLDILLSTKLPARSIILGKLFASISQIILLVVSTLPIFSIIFLFGGITVLNLLQLFMFYIIVAITMGSIGIFFSTCLKKTTVSNVITYGVVLLLVFGTIFISIFYVELYAKQPSYGSYNRTTTLMYFNPLAGFGALIADQFGVGSGGGMIVPGLSVGGKGASKYLWQINAIIDLAIAVVLLALSSYKINPIRKRIFKRSNNN